MKDLLRPIMADDSLRLARFCAAFPGELRPVEFWLRRFRFWWEDNPAFTSGFPRGCLLDAAGNVGGLFALIPTRVQWNGEERLAANMSCWRVLPEWRSHSMRMFVFLMTQAQDYPLFNTTPTREVELMLQRVPFVHFSRAMTTQTLLIRPASATTYWQGMKDVLRIHGHWCPEIMNNGRWQGAGRALERYVQHRWRLGMGSRGAGKRLRVTTIGPEFDRLWQRTRHNFSLTNVRAARDLEWYLHGNPVGGTIDLLAHQRGEELLAFGLFTRRRTNDWPDSEHYLAQDLWSAPPERKNLIPLLDFAADHAARRGIRVLRVPHYHPLLASVCQGIGLTIPLPDLTGYYLPPRGCEPVADPGVYGSRNMGDSGL
ncbi:MAG: hypothetical protein HQL76_07320 [Magnetococcales bacterium]|nr:hypothetical protein [Magnetococcales bacterium]